MTNSANDRGGFFRGEFGNSVIGKRLGNRPSIGSFSFLWLIGSLALIVSGCSTPALHNAVRRGDEAAIRQFAGDGHDIHRTDSGGNTALHCAAIHNRPEGLLPLVDAGANLNQQNRQGRTPLMEAVNAESDSMVALIVSHGADVRIRDDDGLTALHYAARVGLRGAIPALADAGADPKTVEDDGKSPLMVALDHDHKTCAKDLVARGARVDLIDSEGNSVLMHAVPLNDPALIQWLIEQGADDQTVNEDEECAMLMAMKNNHYASASKLVEMGCDYSQMEESDEPRVEAMCLLLQASQRQTDAEACYVQSDFHGAAQLYEEAGQQYSLANAKYVELHSGVRRKEKLQQTGLQIGQIAAMVLGGATTAVSGVKVTALTQHFTNSYLLEPSALSSRQKAESLDQIYRGLGDDCLRSYEECMVMLEQMASRDVVNSGNVTSRHTDQHR